jgi:alpha-amylase/alpha-mannosidase (GH57 family)
VKTVNFFFATHNHQPIGNFDFVLKDAHKHSYKPFFEVAAKHPQVKFGTHFTGSLLDWLIINEPAYLKQLRKLATAGQLEFLTGGYFEPIISVIPPWDQTTQIDSLTTTVREQFGTEPVGMWLAERVWEQGLASVLARAGVKFVLLDDTHFLAAGLSPDALNGTI